MKKRFGLLSLIGATAVLLALVGAITALAAPSAAEVTGTIELDNDWYTITPSGDPTVDGSKVTVTVDDADANVTTPAFQVVKFGSVIDEPLATTSTQLTLSAGEEIVGTPIVLLDTSNCNVGTEDTNLNASVFDAGTGHVLVQTLNATAVPTHRTVCFDKGQVDSVNITVTSTQDTDGIYVSATETSIDSGEFTALIVLDEVASTSTAPFTLKSLDLDTITAKYTDTTPIGGGSDVTLSATASVEQGNPAFSGLLPVDELATQNKQPTFNGTVNDVGGAGIDVSEVFIVFDRGPDEGPNLPNVTGEDGDTSISFTFTPSVQIEGTIAWYVKAGDMAGNSGRSDSDPDDSGGQNFTLKVDITAPAVDIAETGVFFDTDDDVEDGDSLTSVVVRFDDEIDGATVSAADFTVEGIAPIGAEVFSAGDKKNVYLTLADDLEGDAEPVVILAGTVSDLAGNSRTGGTVDAADKIAPSFTVALDESLLKGDDKVVITVSANEKISGVPSIKVHNIDEVTVSTLSVVVKTSVAWEATFTASSAFGGDNSVVVSGSDPGGNASTKGSARVTDGGFGSTAVIVEVDTADPTIAFDAGGVDISVVDAEVESTAPFITMSFNEKVAVHKAEFGVAGETLTDVTAMGNLSSDKKKWIYAAAGLTVDEEYTISIEVNDLAGNDVDGTADFTIIEVPLVEIDLSPGMNLVSVPNAPASSDINTVITSDDVVSVITYDAQAGAFLSATRDAEGNLTGSLTSIDAMHAYWVNSTSFSPIEVEIPQVSFQAIPPSVPVYAGWNLVPIVSLVGAAPGSTTSADTYFGSTSWVRAYTFAAPNTWTQVLPGTFGTVTFGNGYWLYVTQDGILVP